MIGKEVTGGVATANNRKETISKLMLDFPQINVSTADKIPYDGISEYDLLRGVRRVDIKSVLSAYQRSVRHGKIRRYVVDGMPYYSAVVQHA